MERQRLLPKLLFATVGVVIGSFLAPEADYPGRFIKPAFPEIVSSKTVASVLAQMEYRVGRNQWEGRVLAPQVVRLALTTLCTEIECDPGALEKNMHIVGPRDFDEISNGRLYCKNIPKAIPGQVTTGFVDVNNDKAYLNGDVLVKSPKRLFNTSVHEGLHLNAPKKASGPNDLITYMDNKGQLADMRFRKGLVTYVVNHENSLPRVECLRRADVVATTSEEVIVEDLTYKLSDKYGATVPGLGSSVDPAIERYQSKVLPFFGGDYKELLKEQQQTGDAGVYALVGEKISKDPGLDELTYIDIGHDYLAEVFKGVTVGSNN